MKKIFKKIFVYIRALIACTLFVCIFYASFSYLNKAFEDKTIDTGKSFHSLPKNSMDVIVLGSSHAQYSFVPSFFYEQTGLYSYVLGSACQPLEVSYEMLKEALKTQSPKMVILEVYTSMPLRSMCEADSCYVIAGHQMNGSEKINTFNYLEKEKAETYYNPFINNHNNWKLLETIDDLLPQNVLSENNYVDNSFGYVFQPGDYLYPENWWHAKTYSNVDMGVNLDELDLDSLNNIYELCQTNDIELVLYKTPIDSMSEEDFAYLNKVWDWAKERNLNYIDFFEKQNELKFYMYIHSDSFHCYLTGAGIVTEKLGELCLDSEIKFSHIENEFLNSKYNVFSDTYTNIYLINEHDPFTYIDRLKNAKGYVLVKYNPNFTNNRMNVNSYLSNIGVEIDNLNSSYYCLVRNGEIIHGSYEPFEYEYDGHKFILNDTISGVDDKIGTFDNSNLSFAYIDSNFNNVTIKNINTRTSFDYNFNKYSY